jgi:hypothetical protein
VCAPPPNPAFFDHEVRRWRAPASVKTMNRRLGRSLDELTFSFLVLSPRALPVAPPDPRRTRLTSPLARLKGRLAVTGLDGDGARSTYDLLERHVDDAARSRLKGVERGDHVLLPRIAPLREPGWFRIASPADLEVLWHPE